MNRPVWKPVAAVALLIAAILVARAGDLVPATVENTCYRTAAGAPLIGSFVRGSTLRLTNWVVCADSTGSTTQNLAGINVEVTIGTESSATTYTARVYNAAGGAFTCDVTVPTNTTAMQSLEVYLCDTGQTPNVTYTFPSYSLGTRATLR